MNQFERINSSEDQAQDDLDAACAELRVAFPAIVQAVDLEKQTVSAQISLQGKKTDESGSDYQNYPLLVDVPIVWPRAGGFALTFPIKAGDECLVVFADRCVDAWWQSGGVQKPIDDRAHDFSDGFAIFCPTSQPKAIKNVSSDAVDLRNEARSDYISIKEDGQIIIEHTSDLTVKTGGNAQVTITGNATINVGGTADITVDGNTSLTTPQLTVNSPTTNITGNVTIQGTLTANNGTMTVTGSTMSMQGTMNASQDVTGGGISLKSHVHGGVESGPSNTGGPQ